jgi:hypothetical protein
MQRIKRLVTVTAIAAAVTGAVAPGIASAEPSKGSAGTSQQLTKKQLCEALPAVVNTLALVSGAMDPGSAAFAVVHGAQEAIYEAGSKACPS